MARKESGSTPSGAKPTEGARAQVKGLDQIEREQRRKTYMRGGLIAFIALCLAGVGTTVAIKSDSGGSKKGATATENLTPKNITPEGSFQVLKNGSINASGKAAPSSGKRLQVVFDPLCPGCGAFDRATHGDISEKVKKGSVDLRLSPVAFLDKSSTDDYSSRASNAFVTVAEKDPAHAFDFMTALYDEKNQPHEGPQYQPFSDEKLGEVAKSVGVNPTVAAEFPKHSYVKWLAQRTATLDGRKDLFTDGLSTPGIFVGGKDSGDKTEGAKRVQFTTQDSFITALNKALDAAN